MAQSSGVAEKLKMLSFQSTLVAEESLSSDFEHAEISRFASPRGFGASARNRNLTYFSHMHFRPYGFELSRIESRLCASRSRQKKQKARKQILPGVRKN
jgi:hypothetical protein